MYVYTLSPLENATQWKVIAFKYVNIKCARFVVADNCVDNEVTLRNIHTDLQTYTCMSVCKRKHIM